MPCRATPDGWVIVKGSDKTWSLEKEMATPPVFLLGELHGQYEKAKRIEYKTI